MPIGRDGQVHQSAHSIQASDYGHERLYGLFLGIVLEVKLSDNATNLNYIRSNDKTATRGSVHQASVLIVHESTGSVWTVPNAIILSGGLTGVDNYHEELPRGTTQLLDGNALETLETNYDNLDGERCIVQFIGGNIDQPVITHWFPHPSNIDDPATSGLADGSLRQDPRLFKRFNGVRVTITNKGNTYLDTTESSSRVVGNSSGPERKLAELGGDLQVNIKETAKFEINFNKPPNLPESEPSLPQPNNKNAPKIDEERSEDLTRLTMDKEFITAVAAEIVNIVSNNSDIILQPAGELKLGSSEASENFVMGQAYKSFMEGLIDQINLIMVPTAFGPSGTPINQPAFEAIKLTIQNHLSNFIFGQQNPGDP